jgi:glutathione synthase/RimK-type ligase-like ATP-grasp enzyme
MIVGIYFKDPEITDDPLAKEKFRFAYYELIRELKLLGIEAVIVRGQGTYVGGTTFSRHWVAGNSSSPDAYRERGQITVDIIFNRGRLTFDEHVTERVINHPQVQMVAQDKIAMWRLFGDMQAPSRVVTASADFAKLEENKPYVAKVPISKGGEGVVIGFRQDLPAQFAAADYPLLVQDFIETKGGYPGIISGRHDIRVLVAGGDIIGFAVRPRDVQPDGTQQRSWVLPVSAIPAGLLDMTRTIDKAFGHKNRFYSADYFYSDGKWYMIEINATPGLIPHNRGRHADILRRSLARYIQKVGVAVTSSELQHARQ